uniref:Uncharacterized protein n=1 Tax=Parascaris equorum TaxID=6256 RepID=A0A914RGL3_PAREQ
MFYGTSLKAVTAEPRNPQTDPPCRYIVLQVSVPSRKKKFVL